MNKIKIGDKIPEFSLPDQTGSDFHIKNLLGEKNLVIYFYPKDDTPGCTNQAVSFRDSYTIFQRANAEVIGISADNTKSHSKFGRQNELPFILLSDTKNEIRNRFGVPKSFMGLIPGRVTYVIDKQGQVRHIFNSQMEFKKHVKEALQILKELN
jgi:peroxiredoxin Q/BCP